MTKIKITPTIIAGWLVTIGMVIAAVTPVLPGTTPEWLRTTLAVTAVIIAAVMQSIRRVPPTPDEAAAVLAGVPSADAAKATLRARTGRATMPPAAPLLCLALALVLAPLLVGCGGASRVGAAAACSSIMVTIGERRDYTPERAHADIDAVREVCSRLEADGGAS